MMRDPAFRKMVLISLCVAFLVVAIGIVIFKDPIIPEWTPRVN